MAVAVAPLAGVIGATVTGVDMRQVPDAALIDTIETALERHGVLIFPEQVMSPAEQVAFSAALGPLEPTGNIDARLDGHPEIFVVGNTGARPVTFAPQAGSEDLEWHTDHIHRAVPARASMLYAKEIPPDGGDTLFACMYSAYDALSAEDKASYESLNAVHSVSGLRAYLQQQSGDKPYDAGRQAPVPDAVTWPLVRHHPVTGRKALYFGAKVTVGIEGWPPDKALAFVAGLTAHATQDAFVYRHVWRVGDAVLWDNRRALHAATPFDLDSHRRLMHRTTLREIHPV
ncbi:MAG: TauD/TfdA family dioxygenase [Rhodospirillaceae bacterium]|nr:TauD/TfdA family dioxygenase [Rhodospirillaceae bacterium]MDD9924221.1 TauD/TfdA family dioxygenase [Rhodospirillaceae bacterium]